MYSFPLKMITAQQWNNWFPDSEEGHKVNLEHGVTPESKEMLQKLMVVWYEN